MARPSRIGTHPATRPLPSPNRARAMFRGWGKAARVRFFRGQGCSLDEIAAYVGVTPERARQVLYTRNRGK